MIRIVKKPDERKKEIIRSAQQLFLAEGYEKVTMQNVIEHVGIAKGTIYHYFESKKELLDAVIEEMANESLVAMEQVLDESQGDALEKIGKLIRKGRVAEELPDILGMLHNPGNEALHVRLLAVTLTKHAELYAKVIQQGCDEGFFRVDNPLECAELIIAAVQFLTDTGIYPWSEEVLSRRIEAFPKLIELQLQAPPGSFGFLKSLY